MSEGRSEGVVREQEAVRERGSKGVKVSRRKGMRA